MMSLRLLKRVGFLSSRLGQPAAMFSSGKKKKSKSGASGEESGSEERRAKRKAEKASRESAANITQELNLGDVKIINSAPNNQPPVKEDSLTGRYATVLFQSASADGALYNVYQDMAYLQMLIQKSNELRLHTENIGVSPTEHATFKEILQQMGGLADTTFRFLDVLFEQKRMMFLGQIGEKYQKLYQMFNQEEKIRVISAYPLNETQQAQVLEALQQNPDNAGKEFTLSFEVDETIIGGLQLYTESKFMDLSVQSRLEKIHSEMEKMTDL